MVHFCNKGYAQDIHNIATSGHTECKVETRQSIPLLFFIVLQRKQKLWFSFGQKRRLERDQNKNRHQTMFRTELQQLLSRRIERRKNNILYIVQSVWPDLEKLRHFNSTLKNFGHFDRIQIVFGKILTSLWPNFISYWANCHCWKWQNIKK